MTRAHLGDGRHVAQMGQVERRLAHHQQQPAPLLQRHVGGPRQQVVAEGRARSRPASSSSRARRPSPWRRSCRWRCRRRYRPARGCGRPAPRARARSSPSSWCTFSTPAGVATRCVSTPSSRARAQQPHAVDRAAGAGDADDQAAARHALIRPVAQHLLQLAGLVHLHHDVRAADELAVHVQLRNRRPVARIP